MKNKWKFRITNDWNWDWNNPKMVNVEMLSFHLETNVIWITIFGFSLVWEK